MKLVFAKDYEELSARGAELFFSQVKLKPDSVLGLATGTSPIGLYKKLIEWYESGALDFSRVHTVNLDEYTGLEGTHAQSYRFFMNKYLFDHINIDMANTNVPCGAARDLAAECEKYDALIDSLGGIDMQLLGIGNNGHVGFNEPSEAFACGTNVVKLAESTIEANSRLFSDISEVPTGAITMGCRAIMQAKRVVLLASGPAKAEIIKKACFGPVTPQVPASILQLHPDCTVIMDAEAAKLVAGC